jgi:DNA (cytosine-5)-methyltransferase 1
MRPVLLDLFCGGGGAAMGYHRAGFDVVGVDINDQPDYPFRFICDDALECVPRLLGRIRPSVIHASPPCQASSPMSAFRGSVNRHNPSMPEPVNLIPATRGVLMDAGLPYVIESVPYRSTGLVSHLELCGTMFGLIMYRHRWFEFSGHGVVIPYQRHSRHVDRVAPPGRTPTADAPFMAITGRNGHHSRAWVRTAAMSMGTPWLSENLNAVCESIPPAYTQYVGGLLMRICT